MGENNIQKYDNIAYKIGFVALMIVGFCYGWIYDHFENPKD